MAKESYKIPYNPLTGDQMHYPERVYRAQVGVGYSVEEPDWRENVPFDTTLRFKGFRRGRSAAYAEFLNLTTGFLMVVFLTDLEDMIPLMVRGAVSDRFIGTKRGMNYGVKLYTEKK